MFKGIPNSELPYKQQIGDQSSFGVVYKLNVYPPIVVKEIKIENDLDALSRELHTLRELRHKNIVLYQAEPSGYERVAGYFSIFMEYCEYGSLHNVITKVTLIYTIGTLAKWASEIFSALAYLKEKKRVHQDIKPANILVQRGYILKLGDFGLVEHFEERKDDQKVGGTYAYMAPEVRMQIPVDVEETYKKDIYSAGLVLWEILEREYLAVRWPLEQEICFSFSPNAETKALQQLISSCCQKNYSHRLNVSDALRQVKQINKQLERIEAAPFLKDDQKELIEPVGIDGSDRHILVDSKRKMNMRMMKSELFFNNTIPLSTFSPPDAVLESSNHSKQERTDHKYTSGNTGDDQIKQSKISLEDQKILDGILTKVSYRLNFRNRSLMNDYFVWWINFNKSFFYPPEIETYRRIWCPEIEIEKVNSSFHDVNAIREHLSVNFINHYSQMTDEEKMILAENYQKDLGSNVKITEFNQYSDVKLKKFGSHIYPLFVFDFTIQSLCYTQAFYVLMESQSKNLSDWDLLDLLKLSIENIDEVKKIFTRRFYFDVFYLIGSRDEWCLTDHMTIDQQRLWFKKTLYELRKTKRTREGPVDIETRRQAPLDIETIRTILVERSDILQLYMETKQRQQPRDLDERLRRMFKRDFQRKHIGELPVRRYSNYELDISLTNNLSFKNSFFAFHVWPSWTRFALSDMVDGFPKGLNKELQVPIFPSYSKEQIEYVEMYTYYVRAFYLLHRWKTLDNAPEILYLIEKLLEKTRDKKHFKFVCLYVGSEDEEGFFLERLRHETIIFNREFQMLKTDLIVREELDILGFVEVKFGHITEILEAMVESFRQLYRVKSLKEREYEKRFENLIKEFWSKNKAVLHISRNDYGRLPIERCQVVSLKNELNTKRANSLLNGQVFPLMDQVKNVFTTLFPKEETPAVKKQLNQDGIDLD